jgi:hypothetical protein
VPSAPVWTDYYETPSEQLYSWNEYTGEYEQSSSPSPYADYYVFSSATNQYTGYNPTPVVWTKFYATPSVDLYSYDESTNSYFVESNPSPYNTYYVWDESSSSV